MSFRGSSEAREPGIHSPRTALYGRSCGYGFRARRFAAPRNDGRMRVRRGAMTRISPDRRAIGILLVAGLTLTPPSVSAQPQPGRTYKIGFSQLVDHPALNATRQGFLDGLKAEGFEVGRNLVFDYQNAQGDVGTARNIAQKFLADGVDLLAPCTTPVVLATIRVARDTRTPVAFGCVTNPVGGGVLASADQPTGTNVTGFYTVPPVRQNLDLFLAIRPGIRTIGT